MDHSQCFTASLYSLSSSASSSSYLMIKITTDQLPSYNLHGQFSTNQQNKRPILGLRILDNKWMPLLQLISSACLLQLCPTTTLSAPSSCHMRALSLTANYPTSQHNPQSAILLQHNLHHDQHHSAILNPQMCNWLPGRNIRAYPSPWEARAMGTPAQFINPPPVNQL